MMAFTKRAGALMRLLAVALMVAGPMLMVSSDADARGGRGFSMGSRGSRTFSAPPMTRTAPTAAQPMQRTITQPGARTSATAPAGGLFNRPGMGLLGGFAAGFLGAGLLGMLFGHGLFGGLGGLSSLIGLMLQIGLIYLAARLALNWWRRRNTPALADGPAQYNAPPQGGPSQAGPSAGGFGASGFGLGGARAAAPTPITITPDDYDAFERLLGEVQKAWSDEDRAALSRLMTPEMESYFVGDLADNAAKGVVNKVSAVKLLQGDLAEAWREGNDEYATVAMRFSLVDKTIERASGRIVEGGDRPTEATEIWTFHRPVGGAWELSAIQQVA